MTETVRVTNDTYTFQSVLPKLKILFIIHGYADLMGSGAERMVQTIAEFFVGRGHEVTIAVRKPKGSEYNGVKIVQCQVEGFRETVKHYDVVVSHLDLTGYAQDLARDYNKPFFWIAHNTHNYVLIRKRPKYAHVIYNAEWVKSELDYPNAHIVVTPPTDMERWANDIDHDKCEYITLVNHNLNKGGKILVELAKMMPERKFLAVRGSYDVQYEDRTARNIKYIPNTTDMREVYDKTRIILMPSDYESWGLVASEAAASGIPVICHKTKGLWENVGDAAIQIEDRKDYEAWIAAIESLDDKKLYKDRVKMGMDRMKEQRPKEQMINLENWIYGLWQSHRKQYG